MTKKTFNVFENNSEDDIKIREYKIKNKGPEKATFKELVTVAIDRLKDPEATKKKKDMAAKGLLNMAQALDNEILKKGVN
jgi:hypothetical protein